MSLPESTPPPWIVDAGEPVSTGPWGPPELDRAATDAGPAPVSDPVVAAGEAGFAEGFTAGAAQARLEMGPGREALGRLIAEIEREVVAVRHRAEGNLYALALSVARWLLLREVEVDPATIEPLIRRAVSLLPAGSPVEIHACAADVETLTNLLKLTEPDGRAIPVHWVVDPELERGSFTLVSPERIIDGRTDVALRTLYERLAGS